MHKEIHKNKKLIINDIMKVKQPPPPSIFESDFGRNSWPQL